jgi:hypothetical protein
MAELRSKDLRGSTFHEVDHRGSRCRKVWFSEVVEARRRA